MPKKSSHEKWLDLLTTPHGPIYPGWLPSPPKCSLCGVPFAGPGGALFRFFGYRRWQKNPTLCNRCVLRLPDGGAEVDIAILFADIRGSTALGEQLGATAFAQLLHRFYGMAIEVLAAHRAIIDKMIGDEVMAFFTAFSGRDYRRHAILAAVELVRRFREVIPEGELPRLGVGVNAGLAYVGRIGQADARDFTALGDTINVAARLQGEAKAAEVVVADDLYVTVAEEFPEAEYRVLTVRGREEPVAVRVIQPHQPVHRT